MLRCRGAVLLALLLAPGAWAAGVTGEVAFPRGVSLAGDAEVAAGRGVLDLSRAVAEGHAISLRVASAEGYLITREWTEYGPGILAPYAANRVPRNDSIDLGAGTLSNLTCHAGCVALLLADDGGAVSLHGVAMGPLRAVGEARTYARGVNDARDEASFVYRVPADWIAASTAPTRAAPSLVLEGGLPRAGGTLRLYLADASVEWRGEGETRRLSAEPTSRPQEGPAGVPVGRRTSNAFLVLHLADAVLEAPAGTPALLLAPAPSVILHGDLRADEAHGTLLVDGARHDLAGEALEVRGRLDARPTARAASLAARDASFATSLAGDAESIRVGGHALALEDGSGLRPATLAAGLSLVGLLATLLALKLGGVAPFYMRLTRASLLRNDNRRRIHDAARARPGVTVAELVRATGLGEMAVRHHVRMLEIHGYLLVRGQGRQRGCFAVDGAVDPLLIPLHLALKDATRRRIASLVADAPRGLTQAEIAQAAGVSRRLVCHHLSRLEESGLVEATGATPRLYVATASLVGVLHGGAASSLRPPARPREPQRPALEGS